MLTTYDDDHRFILNHVDGVELTAPDDPAARVLVAPAWQGRVMTATVGPRQPDGVAPSFGWVNRRHIAGVASHGFAPQFNALGGSDRFWLGPEGSRFSIFFDAGTPFDIEHWRTPTCLDTEPWAIVGRPTRHDVAMRHETTLVNRAGARFELRIDRTVRALSSRDALVWVTAAVNSANDGLGDHGPANARAAAPATVAYESINTITNIGPRPWRRESGLLSIWILGMYPPGARATILLPVRAGDQHLPGSLVNDAYFGPPAANRLRTRESCVLFRADGRSRGKIGLSPRRATGLAASFDPDRSSLTIVSCQSPDPAAPYVNSMWSDEVDPYAGDAINAYNDGPVTPGGAPLGPFHELETSSPGAELAPGASLTHAHRTVHFAGPFEALEALACSWLGLSLHDAAFGDA